jgi:anti-sigma factor RsiW
MRCDRLPSQLDALFDGVLPATDASALRAHVAGCGDCAALHDAEVGLRAALRRLPVPTATPGFGERALAHAMGLRRRDDRLPRATWPVVIAAFGAGLVLFLLPRLFS